MGKNENNDAEPKAPHLRVQRSWVSCFFLAISAVVSVDELPSLQGGAGELPDHFSLRFAAMPSRVAMSPFELGLLRLKISCAGLPGLLIELPFKLPQARLLLL